MTWAPTEASILGGTATLSTFEKGRVRNHLLKRVLVLTGARVVVYGIVGAFLISSAYNMWHILAKLPALAPLIYFIGALGGLYLSLAIFFGVYSKIALKLEAIEMTGTGIKIQSGENVVTAHWSEVQAVKVSFTSWMSVYRLGGIPGEKTPVIYIKTANWTHIIEWWRYPVEERKQAFLYILRRVTPYKIPITDDFNWIPADYSTYPRITKGVTSEYETLKKVGLYMIGIGMLVCLILMGIGYAGYTPAFTAAAFAFAGAFIGIFLWIAGAAGVDEQKKKKERAKLGQLERLR